MKEVEELLGKELFDQVKEKLGKSELIINNGTYIPKQKFDDVNEDKKTLQKQLEDANTKIGELSSVDVEKLKQEVDDWKTKYESDTKDLNDKISKREYDYVVNDIVRDLKFSSESAKRQFVRDLSDKELKLENGKLLGFEEYKTEYEKNDPNAFVVEKKDDGGDIDTGGDHNPTTNVDPSKMSYDEYKKWRNNN